MSADPVDLANELRDVVSTELRQLLEDADRDLVPLVQAITVDMALAAAYPEPVRSQMTAQLVDQLKAVASVSAVRASDSARAIVGSVIRVAVGAAAAGLKRGMVG